MTESEFRPTDDTVTITFEKPQRAITTGQAVVLSNQDTALVGGTIL